MKRDITLAQEGVVDYWDQLKLEPGVENVGSKICVKSGDVVTLNFTAKFSMSGLGVKKIATLPDELALGSVTTINFASFISAGPTPFTRGFITGDTLYIDMINSDHHYGVFVTYVKP